MALISLNNLERFFNNLKTYISNALSSKVDSNNLKTINNNSLVGTGNITITASSVDWDNVNNKPSTFTPSTHTHAASDITSGLATVATSGSYNDLSNKPTIPTVNNATLKIQKNGTDVKTFTANASSNVTCNITVPTKVSELTNDSGFLTSHQSLSNYSTLSNTVKSLSISGKTITVTPGSGSAYTLTTQDTTYTHPTSSGNKHIPSGGSSGQFLGWSADGTAKWVNNPNTNTWTAMVGATSSSNGSVGYVNAVPPKDGYNTKYLRADGTWQVPPDHTYTVNNATLTIQKNGTTLNTFTANASSDVTCNISVPTKTSDLTNDSGFLTSHQDLSGYIPKAGGAVLNGQTYSRTVDNGILAINGSSTDENGAFLRLHGKDYSDTPYAGSVFIRANNGSNACNMLLRPDGTLIWGSKNVAMQEDTVPRSGGAVLTGKVFARTIDNDSLLLQGATGYDKGAFIELYGASRSDYGYIGNVHIVASASGSLKYLNLYPDGTLTWNGQSIQTTSDQRFKQQINAIDDKLLDAWEDVDLVQFKYNDAVEQKGKDKARLHTGYVVQQIDEACKSHNVDISKYGLYCHEEYAEETREVEQADGTKKTEVVRPANEHYSLRYTEALIVECAFLRKKNKDLQEQLNALSERLEKLENR